MKAPLGLLLLLPCVLAQGACDSTFCSNRGNATAGDTGCSCRCNPPFHGYRCLFSYETDSNVVCGDSWYGQDSLHCAAASEACFWNATTASCEARRSAVVNSSAFTGEAFPDCYNAFPLPFIMIVYAAATIAFGFCCVVVVYFGRYYDTFSRVEDSGERVFNQYYNATSPYISYCVVVVAVSGALAVTSFINLQDPHNCAYVLFVYVYLAIQLLPLVVLLLYLPAAFIKRKCAERGSRSFQLDDHTVPRNADAVSHPFVNHVRFFVF